MGSHKKHKQESSSSDSESSSSEEERTTKKKYSKKSKHHSSEESETEKKTRHVSSSDEKLINRKSKKRVLERNDRRHKKRNQSEEVFRSRYTERKEETVENRDRSSSRTRERDDNRQRKEYHRHEDREHRSYDKRDTRTENRNKREYDRVTQEDGYKNKEVDERRNDKWSSENYRRGKDDGRDRRNGKKRRRSGSYDHASAKWGKDDDNVKSDKSENEKRDKPNFGLSGKLTEERNTFRGVVIKYSEPPEARKPRRRWRLYPFKGEKALQTLYIHRESAYLIGRERKVVDLPVDHPSCSKQHAALQYRLVPFTRDDGSTGKRVRPYLIDLESANGTFINDKKIEPRKYVELLERDVVKFGFSSREYVLLHENSKDEAMDDDVKQEDEEEVKVKREPQE